MIAASQTKQLACDFVTNYSVARLPSAHRAGPLILTRTDIGAGLNVAPDLVAGTAVSGIGTNNNANTNFGWTRRTVNNVLGLAHWPNRTQFVFDSRDPNRNSGGSWIVGTAAAGATVSNATAGPDGLVQATHFTPGSGIYGRYARRGSAAIGKWSFSCWQKAGAGGANTQQMFAQNDEVATIIPASGAAISGTPPAGWTYYSTTLTEILNTKAVIWMPGAGIDCTGAAGTPQTAHAIDVYSDFHQMEIGAYPTDGMNTVGSSGPRGGQRLTTPTGWHLLPGQIPVEVQIEVPCTIADNDADMYLWLDNNDATSFVKIAKATGIVTLSIAGSTNTCTIADANWKAGALIKFFAMCGGGIATVVKYQADANAVVAPAITGAALGAFSPTGSLDLLCNGITNQFAGTVTTLNIYRQGFRPAWAV